MELFYLSLLIIFLIPFNFTIGNIFLYTRYDAK